VNFVNRINKTNALFGAAMDCGERIIVEDVATSPLFAGKPALSAMLGAGARAVQITPLITRGGRALGMLSTHYRRPRRPSDRDLRLIDIIARQTADLIERHHAETALLASERRFRQLADAMPVLVWTANADGYVDYYNERWYEFTGLSRDQFGNESWEPTLHPEDLQKTRDAWSAAIQSGTAYDLEYRLWDRKQNRWRWFVGRALPVRDARGSVVKWFGSCTDIDEQKSVQAELERANEDLEQFAFSASHDLQEPLRAIKIYSELLARRLGEHLDPDAREYLRFLLTGASRMEELIRDLLAYTRATNFEPPASMTDANEALQAALTDLTHAIKETGARVSADPLPLVRVHYTHLHQIFQNLIGNALKYRSPERRPKVHIGGERRDGSCIFAVVDNGIGIAPEYRESIFGLFKRLHTSDQYSGTGIGLAICQRIVGRYHGRIWVESQPGHGSIFRFELPL
jgi:PAS domain S-box-containing protein